MNNNGLLKNNQEIFVKAGLWGDKVNENGKPLEAHFFPSIGKRFCNTDLQMTDLRKRKSVLQKSYPSGVYGISGPDLLQLIINSEDIMPRNTIISAYSVFNNLNSEIFAPKKIIHSHMHRNENLRSPDFSGLENTSAN